MIYYAGIGARKTPIDILSRMESFGKLFALMGFVLRSGGANGADSAFEKGCDSVNGKKEIYLPFKNYNNNNSNLYNVSECAIQIARDLHPGFDNWKDVTKLLTARNNYQILGKDLLTPSSFVVCYSDGNGGTGRSIFVSNVYGIKVFNYYNQSDIDSFEKTILHYVETISKCR